MAAVEGAAHAATAGPRSSSSASWARERPRPRRRRAAAGLERGGRRRAARGRARHADREFFGKRGRGGVPCLEDAEVVPAARATPTAAWSRSAAAPCARSGPRGARPPRRRLARGLRRGGMGAGRAAAPAAGARPRAFERLHAERAPIYERAGRRRPAGRRRELVARALPVAAALREAPRGHPHGVGVSAPASTRRSSATALLGPAAGRSDGPALLRHRHDGRAPVRRRTWSRSPGRSRWSPASGARRWPRPSACSRELAAAGMRRDDHWSRSAAGSSAISRASAPPPTSAGCDVVQVPTTLVAQVDSAYGGKTGVDLPEAKNYVGAYHQPSAVLADPATLATLPPEEMAAGFVEVLKTGLLAGGELWERVRGARRPRRRRGRRRRLRLRAHQARGGRADERDGGRRAGAQPRAHRRPRDRGRDRIRALPPRRGGRARPARGAAALGRRRTPRRGRGLLARHGLPTASTTRVDVDAVLEALERDKKRTGGRRRLRASRRARRAARGPARRAGRACGRPWRSFDERGTGSRCSTASTSTCSAAATRSTTAASRCPSSRCRSSATPRARSRGHVLPVQPRGRVRRVPPPPARARRRRDPQRRRLDPLQLRDPRRTGDRAGSRVEVHLSDIQSREEWRRDRCSKAWCSASCRARAPTATARRSRC